MDDLAPQTPAAGRRSRRQALVAAVAAVRSTDRAGVESAIEELGRKRRWLVPLAYAAGTIGVVFDGVVLLLRNWRLTLLQLLPAMWIWVMTWNMKHHFVSKPSISVGVSILVAVAVLVTAQAAYWCNATFAFTLVGEAEGDIAGAFAEARRHWRTIGGLALLTGSVQATIWLLMPHVNTHWLWLALLLMFVVQVYLFI